MKPNPGPELDKLHEVLRWWTLNTSLPPRFQEQVWRRIARAATKPSPILAFCAEFWQFLKANLPRPKVAYAYVAILLLLGVVGGAWTAQLETHRLDEALGSRYAQSVDPYQKLALNHKPQP